MRDEQVRAQPDDTPGADVPLASDLLGPRSGSAPQTPWLLRQPGHTDPVRAWPAAPVRAKWSRRRSLALIFGLSAMLWGLLLGWFAL